MSLALYIELDNQCPGFDTFVNGKAIAHCDELEAIVKSLGLREIHEFIGSDAYEADFSDDFDDIDEAEDFEENGRVGEKWFSAKEGIEYFSKIKHHLQDAANIPNIENVISDIDEYIEILTKALAINAKWHLGIDY